ncbi:hypothetical protein N658DRAFT_565712 [Parathielavia hyrcaniae]|uniref:Aminoglycoside phosphotransferase domain-containing protein n=1 Tax=Parathielavia hyrcaniae TaxID=113614 RepID=A0AAN6Q4D7_9PEZI|nr:hypothetical protein N658DRAFT_565712 [Parathielavia hyrcaniae]
MGWRDEWPSMPDGTPYDGKHLLLLARAGKSPFDGVWDVRLLVREIEEKLNTRVTDIPFIDKGSNNYGILLKTADGRDMVARLARSDVNMPDFDDFPVAVQGAEVRFESTVYHLLRSEVLLLDQAATMRAALFRYDPPHDFSTQYFLERVFRFMPDSLSMPIAPTRDEGDMIRWEDDEETVGPRALAAKQALLKAIPCLLPPETPEASLFRLVLEYGDFGIHNMTITKKVNGEPVVTSLFDWETACIWPALLSDPLMAVSPVDLIVDEDAGPSVTRLPEDATPADLETYKTWASHYVKRLYHEDPGYKAVIRAGKDFRYLWYALRDWRGGDSEKFFGALGAWAEKWIQELEGPI